MATRTINLILTEEEAKALFTAAALFVSIDRTDPLYQTVVMNPLPLQAAKRALGELAQSIYPNQKERQPCCDYREGTSDD